MKKDLWFRAKTYGWGWTPTTSQGWSVLLVYLIGIVLLGILATENTTAMNYFFYTVEGIILTIFLFIICYLKGEKPSWRWGK